MPEMTEEFKEQLIEFLKENLVLKSKTEKMECFSDVETTTIKLVLCDEEISTVYIEH